MSFAETFSMSGLSLRQVGRLFGVPARQVAEWLRTGNVPEKHRQAARRFTDQVNAAASDVRTVREVLLDSSAGPSMFHELMVEPDRRQQIQWYL